MNGNKPVMLCSDLDRTIIPNGHQPESRQARPLLRQLAQRPELILVYVTGRDTMLITEAIKTYRLPLPDLVVGDVGTSIYKVYGDPENPGFDQWDNWKDEIALDWGGKSASELANIIKDFKMLRLQEPEKQKDCKLSFYADAAADLHLAARRIEKRMKEHGVRASVITSIDEIKNTGLVDILPERATKVHAVCYIINKMRIHKSRVVYAGDSGNDLPALTSGLQAVLVKNAANEVAEQALAILSEKRLQAMLYMAKGGFYGMNGNYSAGVLEGLAHFVPEAGKWIKQEVGSR